MMDNSSIQTVDTRDAEPKMIRLRSEPIDLYKKEDGNPTPYMKRLKSEPTDLNNCQRIHEELKSNSKHIIRPPVQTNNFLRGSN